MPESLASVIRTHPVFLPYCADNTCCDPMERQEVADTLAPFLPLTQSMADLLDKVGTCPRCLRPNSAHSIHCHRHPTPTPIA